MFSFAKNIVKSIEKSAESIISANSHENDPYFLSAGTSYGFRVLHVDDNSKAADLGLEPWFDYVVAINGHGLLTQPGSPIPDYSLFIEELQNCVGRPVQFSVWNAKGGVCRLVHIPTLGQFENNDGTVYNSEGFLVDTELHVVTNCKFETLGFCVQATPLITATYVYHVLEIQPNLPAERCGLVPHADYVVGANDGLFATGGEDLFGRVINLIYSRNPELCSIDLYVYNHDFDVVRPVTIKPAAGWGGNGILGCGVGYGYLHRLPQVVGKFEPDHSEHHLQPPGQTLFTLPENMDSKEFVPAVVKTQTAPPRRKKKHVAPQATDYSDYFKQETEKSEKLDVRTLKPDDALPPPPKKL